MKSSIYELLGMVKDESVDYKYVKYFDRINEKDDVMLACKENIIYKLDHSNIELNDKVEFLEEPKGIPEKIKLTNGGLTLHDNNNDYTLSVIHKCLINKINEIIDYLESKGE